MPDCAGRGKISGKKAVVKWSTASSRPTATPGMEKVIRDMVNTGTKENSTRTPETTL
jgi:hypothetical protein